MTDASRTARNPELVTLRGRTPLVLVPIANPGNAEAMIALADALVPADVGRVLLHNVIVAPHDWQPDNDVTPIERSQRLLPQLLRASVRAGIRVELIVTMSAEPMKEISRVSQLHRCQSVLLGLSEISGNQRGEHLEVLLSELDANVVVLRSGQNWQLADATRVLVPVAGRGGHEHLMALLIGSLLRTGEREVTYLRVVAPGARPDEMKRAQRDLDMLVDDDLRDRCRTVVMASDDPVATVADWAERSDLLILGVQRIGRRQKLFGSFTRELAERTDCAMIAVSRRG
jgi:nucleotide-binding universal stress UspA family protein